MEETTNQDSVPNYPTVVDRYFQRRYKLDIGGKKGQDVCILTHSNKICIVTLPPSHPVYEDGRKVTKVDFQVSKNVNRLNNKVSGKGKKGAQWLNVDSPLCKLSCSDGSEYIVHSGMRGNLVEVNENLPQHPELIHDKPDSDGYIAIILPKLGEYEKEMGKLMSHKEYQQKMEQLKSPAANDNNEDG